MGEEEVAGEGDEVAAVVAVMSVQPTSEKVTSAQDSGSAASAGACPGSARITASAVAAPNPSKVRFCMMFSPLLWRSRTAVEPTLDGAKHGLSGGATGLL